MTFKEFLETTSHISPSVGRHRFRKRQRFFIKFFKEHSTEPQRSIWLLWAFGICTLPSLAALNLAEYVAIHNGKLKYAFIGNLILIAINVALVIWSKIYRNNHPPDDAIAEKLNAKRMREKECGRNNSIKSIVVYVVVGLFFLCILLFFLLLVKTIFFQ